MDGLAATNFEKHLRQNVYPGRGIVVGKSTSGDLVQVYWIMGRSANSRNRVFVYENEVRMRAARDAPQLRDSRLIGPAH